MRRRFYVGNSRRNRTVVANVGTVSLFNCLQRLRHMHVVEHLIISTFCLRILTSYVIILTEHELEKTNKQGFIFLTPLIRCVVLPVRSGCFFETN